MIHIAISNFKNRYVIKMILSSLCGMCGVLAFSPYDFWLASIISLTGLFIIILDNTWKETIWYTLFWGLGFFSIGLHWIYFGITQFYTTYSSIHILLIVILIIYLTSYFILFSIFFIILQIFITKWSIISIITAILWLIIERLRSNSLVGFSWLQFGYSQIDGPIKGIGPILGVEGITFILVYVSVLLAFSIKTFQLLPLYISLLILLIVYPLAWIQWVHPEPNKKVTISLVQGNVNQNIYWNINDIESTLKIYLKHTLPLLGKTNIIIWPESAIPGNELDYNKFLTKLDLQLRKYQTYLVTGIIDTQYINNNYYHYNSIIVLGNIKPYVYPSDNRYNKHHLVLCAERFPLQFLFEPLLQFLNIPISFISQGHYLQPQLFFSNIKMTASICYEITFGEQIRDNFKFDTDFLLSIANDVWFGSSIGPWQHFQIARMRGLELGRPVLFCMNNGISAIINADGSIQSKTSQFIDTVLTSKINPTTGLTPYAKFGSTWLTIIIIVFGVYLFFSIKKFFKQ